MIGFLAVLLAAAGLVVIVLTASGVGVAMVLLGLLVACLRLAVLEGRAPR